MIWKHAIPDDEPEIFMHQATEYWWSRNKARAPMYVDTGFPVVMHVCHESRDFVQKFGGLHFRSSPDAPCPIPCRPFRPELDTVFWNEKACSFEYGFLQAPYYHWMKQLRHLALPTTAAFPIQNVQNVTEAVIRNCPNLRKLSLVAYPGSTRDAFCWRTPKAIGPERRKLRTYRLLRRKAMYATAAWLQWDPGYQHSIERFFLLFCKDGAADEHGESSSAVTRPPLLANVDCLAQTFVEWDHGSWTTKSTEKKRSPFDTSVCPLGRRDPHHCWIGGLYQPWGQ
jgi:hypothetical protein